MSDILKAPSSVNHNDAISRVRPSKPQETNVHTVADPTKVSKSNQKEQFLNDSNPYLQKNKSNFESFLSRLQKSEMLSNIFGDNFLFRLENILNSNLDSSFSMEINDLMQLLNMTEDELLFFVKNQFNSSAKFSGEFFDDLRNIYNSTNSQDIKHAILDLLKKFDSFSSSNHTNNNILSNLDTILSYMPKTNADNLRSLMQNLYLHIQNGDISDNLNTLKDDIIPYLGKFIKQTNNFGDIRGYISLLTANVARLENGDRNALISSFDYLTSFNDVRRLLSNPNLDQTKQFLLNMKLETQNLSLVDKLMSLISQGYKGKGSHINSSVFESMVSTMLLNESVYMPLMHTIVPANINGTMFFSEIWVDKDAKSSSTDQSVQNCFKFLIKFDIENIGFFEMILLYQDNIVDLNLYIPDNFKNDHKLVQNGIKSILEKNELSLKNLLIEQNLKPKSLPEVFPKILERKPTINVSI